MTKNLTAVGFGLALLLACGRQAPSDYFPLRAGQQRAMKVYTRMIEDTDTTETTEVRVVEIVHGLKDVPGMGKCWIVESPRVLPSDLRSTMPIQGECPCGPEGGSLRTRRTGTSGHSRLRTRFRKRRSQHSRRWIMLISVGWLPPACLRPAPSSDYARGSCSAS
jgi:hypothetical protein